MGGARYLVAARSHGICPVSIDWSTAAAIHSDSLSDWRWLDSS